MYPLMHCASPHFKGRSCIAFSVIWRGYAMLFAGKGPICSGGKLTPYLAPFIIASVFHSLLKQRVISVAIVDCGLLLAAFAICANTG